MTPPTSLENPASTSNQRVVAFHDLPSPKQLLDDVPLGEELANDVEVARRAIADVIANEDDRLLVVVGPCSVHDPEAAVDYARRLKAVADELSEDLLVVMRVYFEKPRTTVGWKGLINDPHMDGSFEILDGLRMARELLIEVLQVGLPVGAEFLEPNSPQYIADAVAWGAIGARTTESQVHRQLASGLSMPIGFKNGTDGNVQVAVDSLVIVLLLVVILLIGVDLTRRMKRMRRRRAFAEEHGMDPFDIEGIDRAMADHESSGGLDGEAIVEDRFSGEPELRERRSKD